MTAFFLMMMRTGESEPLKRRCPRRLDLRGHRILVAGAGFTRAIQSLALRARSFALANFACKKGLHGLFAEPTTFGNPEVAALSQPHNEITKIKRPPDFHQEAF
jgi:hypothetical protein